MTARRKKRQGKWAIWLGVALFALVFALTWWRSNRCEVCGIDISHYQGKIDWKTVAAQDIRFVFIKATEGQSVTDEEFHANWEAAGETEILRGAYHFFRPGTDADAQAQHFLKRTKGLSGELPPVLDLEVTDDKSAAEIRKGVKKWMEVVEKARGRKPILYTMPKFADSYLDGELKSYPIWIADLRKGPPRMPKHWSDWTFRQYSHHGRVKGIQGDVDLDCFNGTLEELAEFAQSP